MNLIEIVTNIAPHYRVALWQNLLFSRRFLFRFIFGVDHQTSIKQIDLSDGEWDTYRDRIQKVSNVYFGRILVWQSGSIARVLRTKAKAIIVLDTMYVVSNWLCILIARLRGIKVLFWGHGFYGDEKGIKRTLRLFFLRRADAILVYGHRAKHRLIKNGFPDNRIYVVFNSLDYEKQKSIRYSVIDSRFYASGNFFADPDLPVIIFVGRLTSQKKLDLALDAISSLSPKVNLIFVGDGPERSFLEKKAAKIIGQVFFFGACYDEIMLGRLIANADLCLAPGEVGLTAIHSLSFGTPVCTHDDFDRQMPEVDALVAGKTGVFFSLDQNNLAETLRNWFLNRPDRESTRGLCYDVIDNQYNPHVQLKIFESALMDLGL